MGTVRALLPGAGAGRRFGGGVPKQRRLLNGLPLMAHTVAAFLGAGGIASVHAVLSPGDRGEALAGLAAPGGGPRLVVHRSGGATRGESVLNGLLEMGAAPGDWVVVHDMARPCVGADLIGRILDGIDREEHGRIAALPVRDTVKRVAGGTVRDTVGRDGKWLAQTPQAFRHGDLVGMLRAGTDVPDESAAFEAAGRFPTVVPGDPSNIKVTVPADLALAEAILGARARA